MKYLILYKVTDTPISKFREPCTLCNVSDDGKKINLTERISLNGNRTDKKTSGKLKKELDKTYMIESLQEGIEETKTKTLSKLPLFVCQGTEKRGIMAAT